jgi:hypothetical protein
MNPPHLQEIELQQMMQTLEQLIDYQRQEQEMILKRQSLGLPLLCEKMNTLTQEIERHQSILQSHASQKPSSTVFETFRKKYTDRFKVLQEIALQNDLLLENSLRFLQEIIHQTTGIQIPPCLYNELGFAEVQGNATGVLLDKKV